MQPHAPPLEVQTVQSERSLRMVFWLALCEKRSECFLRLVGLYSFGKHLVLEFHSLLQLVTECRLHEPLRSLHCAGTRDSAPGTGWPRESSEPSRNVTTKISNVRMYLFVLKFTSRSRLT